MVAPCLILRWRGEWWPPEMVIHPQKLVILSRLSVEQKSNLSAFCVNAYCLLSSESLIILQTDTTKVSSNPPCTCSSLTSTQHSSFNDSWLPCPAPGLGLASIFDKRDVGGYTSFTRVIAIFALQLAITMFSTNKKSMSITMCAYCMFLDNIGPTLKCICGR